MDARSGIVSRRDATITSLIAFGLGAVLTAFVLAGSEIPLKCIDGGNMADWLAATFTGSVGFGACWFAYEANRHRRDEVQRQERRERISRNSRLALVLHACATASIVEPRLLALSNMPAEEISFFRFAMVLRILRKAINRHDWAGLERNLLGEDGVRALTQLEMRLLQFDDIAEQSLTDFTNDPDSFDEGKEEAIDALLKTGEDITECAKTLTHVVLAIRDAPDFSDQ